MGGKPPGTRPCFFAVIYMALTALGALIAALFTFAFQRGIINEAAKSYRILAGGWGFCRPAAFPVEWHGRGTHRVDRHETSQLM